MDPTLTIMMPSFNYGTYISQAITSILNQSYTDFEFLIVEDGSSDNSPEIIQEYMRKDPRIRGIFYKQNKGMLQCVNEGTQLAKGKYIHYLAADDFRYPGFLQKCMDILTQNKNLGMCCTQFHYGNEENLLLETCGYPSNGKTLFLEPKDMRYAFYKQNLKIFALAAILKKEHVQEYGGFDPKLYYLSDWYLLNEIAFNHPLALICEPLSRFRIHDCNFSNVFRHNKKTKMAAYGRLFEKLQEPKNAFYKEQIRTTALLSFVFQDLFWKLLVNPKYLSFWPYINQKYPIKSRLKKSLKKKLGLKQTLSI